MTPADGGLHCVTPGTALLLQRHRLVDELAGRQLEGRWRWKVTNMSNVTGIACSILLFVCIMEQCANVQELPNLVRLLHFKRVMS